MAKVEGKKKPGFFKKLFRGFSKENLKDYVSEESILSPESEVSLEDPDARGRSFSNLSSPGSPSKVNPELLRGSFEWGVFYLGTIPNVPDWRTSATRTQFMEMIDDAVEDCYVTFNSQPLSLLCISPLWLHITDMKRKVLFTHYEVRNIGSLSYIEDEGHHILGIKARTMFGGSSYECVILDCRSEVAARHIGGTLKNMFELMLFQAQSEKRALRTIRSMPQMSAPGGAAGVNRSQDVKRTSQFSSDSDGSDYQRGHSRIRVIRAVSPRQQGRNQLRGQEMPPMVEEGDEEETTSVPSREARVSEEDGHEEAASPTDDVEAATGTTADVTASETTPDVEPQQAADGEQVNADSLEQVLADSSETPEVLTEQPSSTAEEVAELEQASEVAALLTSMAQPGDQGMEWSAQSTPIDESQEEQTQEVADNLPPPPPPPPALSDTNAATGEPSAPLAPVSSEVPQAPPVPLSTPPAPPPPPGVPPPPAPPTAPPAPSSAPPIPPHPPEAPAARPTSPVTDQTNATPSPPPPPPPPRPEETLTEQSGETAPAETPALPLPPITTTASEATAADTRVEKEEDTPREPDLNLPEWRLQELGQESFMEKVNEALGGIAFTEFKTLMDGYKRGHSDYSVAAVSRRIKVLFRGAKEYLREGVRVMIKPEELLTFEQKVGINAPPLDLQKLAREGLKLREQKKLTSQPSSAPGPQRRSFRKFEPQDSRSQSNPSPKRPARVWTQKKHTTPAVPSAASPPQIKAHPAPSLKATSQSRAARTKEQASAPRALNFKATSAASFKAAPTKKPSSQVSTELSFLEDELSALDDVLKGIGEDLQEFESVDTLGQTSAPQPSNKGAVPPPPPPPGSKGPVRQPQGTKSSIPAAPPLPGGAPIPPPPPIPGSTQSKKSAGSSRADLLSEIRSGRGVQKSTSELKLDSLGPPPSFSPTPPASPPLPRQPTVKKTAKRPTAEVGRFQGVQSIVKEEDGGVPSWKKRVIAGRQAKVEADQSRKANEAQQEAEKYEGVPEWKKKLMDKKREEIEEKMRPQREKEEQERQLREKLASMPPWKQELFKKKHDML